jgi:PAS domain S-box-containing protein
VVRTEELQQRPSRPPDHAKENAALVALAGALTESRDTIFEILADTILRVTGADSSGLSLLTSDGLTPDDEGQRFYWPAITGMWKDHVGAPAAEEILLVPFCVQGKAVGNLWAIMHSDRRKFDLEDQRLMSVLGQFAALAYQTLGSIDDLKEEFHRVIVETASDAVVSIDHRGNILLANHATTRSFGYKPEELIGQPLTILMPEYLRDLHKAGLARYQETNHRHINWQSTELIGLRKNGEEFPVEVSFGEIDNKGQRVFTGFIRDISERKKMEEALRKNQAQLSRAIQTATVGEFAAAIAHEVNQPLAAVVTNGQACLRWLAAEPTGIAKAQEAAERIVRDGKEAGEIVRRIRALFKQSAMEKIELDLNEVIREVLHLLDGETTRRSVTVETALVEDLAPVTGDRVQLQQVIFNLLLNGIEAMDSIVDRPRQLFIGSKQPVPEAVVVEVRDSGIGLKDPDRIFDAFFTTKDNGMGMGLAICRSIIDAHHGRLWAAASSGANGEGSGTTFSFSLPVPTAAVR